jgi:hypothetical protein
MEGTTHSEHDQWMDKITQALRSFRAASQRKAEQMQAHRAPQQGDDRAPFGGERT